MSVCGTVVRTVKFRSFSWKALRSGPRKPKPARPRNSTRMSLKTAYRIYLACAAQSPDANPIRRRYIFPPSLHHLCAGQGILTLCPSPATFVIGLGPTNPWMTTIAKETLIFRRGGILPPLRLLVPAFSLPYAPPWLAPLASSQMECSLTACSVRRHHTPSASVSCLNPDYLWRKISR